MARHISPRRDPQDLQKYGPRFEIEVGPPILRNQKGIRLDQGLQTFSRMPALIDTGAGRTVVTPDAVKRVGLPVVDYTTFTRAGGQDKTSAHVASIQFPGSKLAMIEVVQVLCCELPGGLFQCLIGRDILSRWLFTYNGKIGHWFIDEEDLPAFVEPPEGLFT